MTGVLAVIKTSMRETKVSKSCESFKVKHLLFSAAGSKSKSKKTKRDQK